MARKWLCLCCICSGKCFYWDIPSNLVISTLGRQHGVVCMRGCLPSSRDVNFRSIQSNTHVVLCIRDMLNILQTTYFFEPKLQFTTFSYGSFPVAMSSYKFADSTVHLRWTLTCEGWRCKMWFEYASDPHSWECLGWTSCMSTTTRSQSTLACEISPRWLTWYCIGDYQRFFSSNLKSEDWSSIDSWPSPDAVGPEGTTYLMDSGANVPSIIIYTLDCEQHGAIHTF